MQPLPNGGQARHVGNQAVVAQDQLAHCLQSLADGREETVLKHRDPPREVGRDSRGDDGLVRVQFKRTAAAEEASDGQPLASKEPSRVQHAPVVVSDGRIIRF